MDAHEVIDSYVRDVARHLPRAKRDDVAFELGALLADELADRADAESRTPDRAMAMDLLADFGRPAEAAARYHPRPPLIDPADTHDLVIWAVAGSLLVAARRPGEGIAFLGWIGGVFLAFACLGWMRRHRPAGVLRWRPKPVRRPEVIHRALPLLALAATVLFPVGMYLAPPMFAEAFFLGTVPTSGLELTPDFLASWQRAATLGALAAVVALYAALALQGGWRPWTRWTSVVVHVVLGLLLLVHAAPMTTLLGRETFQIFTSPTANAVVPPIFGVVGVFVLLVALYDGYREWTRIEPAPTPADSLPSRGRESASARAVTRHAAS